MNTSTQHAIKSEEEQTTTMAMWKWIEAGQEQDNQKPLQDLFYRREKLIQKYGSENDINWNCEFILCCANP